jgi:ATP-dependent RNA helicase RhlE
MNQGHVMLRDIQVLVLDEADRMLDMGFIRDIRRIVEKLPRERQTMLFSATMPNEIRQLADSLLTKPTVVQVAPVATTVEKVEQSVYFVDKPNKPQLLAHLVNELPMSRAIVFTRTKHGADKVVRHLHSRGIKAEAIHGNKSQNAPRAALDNFKSGKIPVLIATDIASRGIDVDNVSHVVNYDLTHEPETYVHRIGRTARAGQGGAAISFCDREERENLRAIEKLIRQTIPVCDEQPAYEQRAAKPMHDVRPMHSHGGGATVRTARVARSPRWAAGTSSSASGRHSARPKRAASRGRITLRNTQPLRLRRRVASQRRPPPRRPGVQAALHRQGQTRRPPSRVLSGARTHRLCRFRCAERFVPGYRRRSA